MLSVIEWTEPPQMDTGAPSPAIESADGALVVAYLCGAAAAPEHAAVVRFDGVFWLHFGDPNDEGLSEHPFYGIGLRHYAFWEIIESPNIPAGTSFRSKLFAASSHKLGLTHLFTKPYRPQTNGKAERFIQTITREWAYARSYNSSRHRATYLPHYLHDYNFHRPHSALHSLPPSSRLPKTADNVSRYNS